MPYFLTLYVSHLRNNRDNAELCIIPLALRVENAFLKITNVELSAREPEVAPYSIFAFSVAHYSLIMKSRPKDVILNQMFAGCVVNLFPRFPNSKIYEALKDRIKERSFMEEVGLDGIARNTEKCCLE